MVTATAPAEIDWTERIFLGLLVVLLPLAILSHFAFSGPVTFIVCALALVPLARQMGTATESIAEHAGAAVGGLLNATFGNAAELILALVALRAGEAEVVKASITGSILGNILLVAGGSVLAGGLKYPKQTFNIAGALSGASMMYLALVALAVPDLFHIARGAAAGPVLWPLSIATSIVLLVIYGLSLLFSLKTHAHLYASETEEGGAAWSMRRSLIVLVLSTVAVAVVAEFLVGALEEAIAGFGLTRTFVGLVILAVVGNAAEHSTAVVTALKNKLDVSFNIAFESSKQIALFVAPLLVLLSGLLGHPMTLEFSHMEVLGIALAVGGVTLIVLDGETHWLEGVMLLGVYAILAVAFFFVP
jgi:Ca2+:H+ antiporter